MAPQPSGGEGTRPGTLSMAEVAFLAHKYWVQIPMGASSWLPESALRPAAITAIAVAWAESHGDPNAVSSTGDYGVWQINLAAHKDLNLSGEQLKNADINARAAYKIWQQAKGFTPWTTYKRGSHAVYMAQATIAYAHRKAPGISGIGGMDPLQNDLSPLEEVTNFFASVNTFFTDLPKNFMRIGEFIGGAGLILIALILVAKKGVK